ncbi:hypothetical protein VV867_08685 [Pseudomonas sp. JH-2]|uniref:hypothetical protein n=1 Tax=Pseudomonas sp. JH-2 TaxID=3114998 RepID=UPI002E26EA5A|nr:hypothetical protein [Pseudomonas sp. JH-2]
MNPGTFVTLMIFGWLLLAGVTLWAFLRVPMRRARLHSRSEAQAHPHEAPAPQAQPQPAPRRRHAGWLAWNHR